MTDLRRPAEWRGGRVTGVLFIALMAPAVIALLVTAARTSNVPTIFVAVTFSLSVCAFLAGVLRERVFERVEPDIDTSGARLTLRYDRVYSRLSRVALALVAVGGVVFVVGVPAGILDLSLTPGQRVFFPLGVGVIVAAAAYGEYSRLKNGPPAITSDTETMTHHRTSTRTAFRWADITRIDAERIGSWPKRDVVTVETKTTELSKPYVLGDAPCYSPGGAALYWMIRFYWLNPDHRDELTDGRAEKRLRSGDFPLK